MKRSVSAFGLLVSLAGRASIAAADDPAPAPYLDVSIEDLLNIHVGVASKMEEKISEAPGVVTVITRKEIEAFGAVSLVDILQRAPSVNLMSSHLWVQAKPVIRGVLITHADDHTLVLINGRPFRDALESNSNWALYTSFPVDLIERIEIVRGPGSVLYGSDAIAGVINIITRAPVHQNVFRATVSGGSFGGKAASAMALVGYKDLKLALGGNFFVEDGWDLNATTKLGPMVQTMGKRMGENNKSLVATLEFRGFKAQGSYSDTKQDVIGILPVWLSPTANIQGKRLFIDLGYSHAITDAVSFDINATRNSWEKHIRDAPGDNQDHTDATVLEAAVKGHIHKRVGFVVGALTEIRSNHDVVVFIPGVQSPAVPISYDEHHYSAYASLDWRVFEPLKLIGGLQYNRTASKKHAVVPRLGAIYAFTDAVTLKALYGQAFRTATPLEEYVDIPTVLKGNPQLRPELVTTYDLQLLVNTPRVQLAATVFHTRLRDLVSRTFVDQTVDLTETFINAAQYNLTGVELEANVPVTEAFHATGSFTYQKEANDRLLIPSFMVKAGAFYSIHGLTAGVFGPIFGAGRQVDGYNPNRTDLNPAAKTISLVSVNLRYDFHGLGFPLAAEVYASNLLNDARWYPEFSRNEVNTLPIGPGRAFYAKLSLQF